MYNKIDVTSPVLKFQNPIKNCFNSSASGPAAKAFSAKSVAETNADAVNISGSFRKVLMLLLLEIDEFFFAKSFRFCCCSQRRGATAVFLVERDDLLRETTDVAAAVVVVVATCDLHASMFFVLRRREEKISNLMDKALRDPLGFRDLFLLAPNNETPDKNRSRVSLSLSYSSHVNYREEEEEEEEEEEVPLAVYCLSLFCFLTTHHKNNSTARVLFFLFR